ncbi:hypothetical protein BOX15_Mlig024085g1 [Macrostomum lignano]|uniref:C2 domain-containing protein n=2 Tax=Macrostomum lignano TaxID=282301 RepID=A0A267EHU8_9PLAT|nr:hypothetical protein BOX15_Mlig024085g1 [Macrostomum lignano]
MASNVKPSLSSDRMSAFWESEKSSPCIIPRVLLIRIDRMCVYANNGDEAGPVYLAIRMHAGSRRTLRSQQITVPERGQVFEHPITVEIQYPHAIKRDNPLLIMLQRRKKYRNLGFKTMGLAQVNLSDVLQCRLLQHQLDLLPESSSKVDQSSMSGKSSSAAAAAAANRRPVGFLHVVRLETLPPPRDLAACRKDFAAAVAGAVASGRWTDEAISDEDETDHGVDEDEEDEKIKKDAVNKPKEWRQKFKLFMDENFSTILKLKKLKGGQQFELDYQPELQNESLWNDLDDAEPDSDSSLDDDDELSVQSTPKPSLRRYFGSQASDCGKPLASTAAAPGLKQHQQQHRRLLADEPDTMDDPPATGQSLLQPPAPLPPSQPTLSPTPLMSTTSSQQAPSVTARGSALLPFDNPLTDPRKECIEAVHRLHGEPLPERLCIVCTAEAGGRALLEALQSEMRLPCVPTASPADCRHAIGHMAAALAQTPNPAGRAGAPPPPALHRICLLGSDQHANAVLRAYVDHFGSRPPGWQSRVRFHYAPLPGGPTACAQLCRHLAGCDPTYAKLFHADDWRDSSPSEAARRIWRYLTGASGLLGLPIGEVMLATGLRHAESSEASETAAQQQQQQQQQVPGSASSASAATSGSAVTATATAASGSAVASSTDGSAGVGGVAVGAAASGSMDDTDVVGFASCPLGAQTFVPFVVGVRIGLAEHPDSDGEQQHHQLHHHHHPHHHQTSPAAGHLHGSGTPPQSPNLNDGGGGGGSGGGEFVDLQLDYWTAGNERKTALKPAFRALYISRLAQPAAADDKTSASGGPSGGAGAGGSVSARGLVMTVVNREKKQKIMRLGKKGKETEGKREVVENLSRLICTSKSQSHPMKVVVDGVDWSGVKFFQLSSQWQTNVKQMPIAVFQAGKTASAMGL